ncbi:MAG: peptidoglycan DD-metalloendopeptidase family protein [Gemmatimonadota bacterium]|nr:peptidoglycan DD-metalloendopeptidase family protein [Gemmatimonadota bacterium]
MRALVPRAVAVFALLAAPLSAQQQPPADVRQQIAESQRRLEEIRSERARLNTELNNLRSQVRDVSSEIQNIERQLNTSRSAVVEMDFQLETVSSEVTRITTSLSSTREDLTRKRRALGTRLREVFKRGPLNAVRVLLGAESFADLLNRYRYLYLLTSLDQTLVDRVATLERSLVDQGAELEGQLAELGRLRDAKLQEERELVRVQRTHQATLSTYRQSAQAAEGRLAELEARDQRMTALVEDLEERRRTEEQRTRVAGGPAPAASTLSAADVGALDWPVDGQILYRFGLEQRPNGTALRWNGLGIAAPVGTPVHAVRPGLVVHAGPLEGYGPTVMLSHGEGFYTLYLYLDGVTVAEGRSVTDGQVLGTVGGANTPEGPHLEFQVRMRIGGSSPQATDPLQWLKARPGS